MKAKKQEKKGGSNSKNDDVNSFIKSKISSFQDIIKKTILGIQKYKHLEILGVNEINTCIVSLEKIFSELNEILIIVSANYDIKLQNNFINKQTFSKTST